MRRDDVLRKLREHYREIQQMGVKRLYLFGSTARDEAKPDSDIDLLVNQDWSRLSGWGGMELVVALEDLLGRRVDVATEEELKPLIRERVLNEAVKL